jgi:uncharacterized protein (TIGR03435 family)
MTTERFNVEAKAARPHTVDDLHTMLAHLLEERFHLKVRHEMRQESVWNLVVANGGSKMPVYDPADKDYPLWAHNSPGTRTERCAPPCKVTTRP